MQYLMMLTFRPGEGPQEGTPEFAAEMKVWGGLNEELRAAGALVGASGLQPDTATTVRRRRRHRRPVRGDQGDPLLLLHPRGRGPGRGDGWAPRCRPAGTAR